jgi:hypothetical protein
MIGVVQYVIYIIQHTIYIIQHTIYIIQHTIYIIQHTISIYFHSFFSFSNISKEKLTVVLKLTFSDLGKIAINLLSTRTPTEFLILGWCILLRSCFNENHKSISFVRNLLCLYCTQTTLHVSAIQPSSSVSYIQKC